MGFAVSLAGWREEDLKTNADVLYLGLSPTDAEFRAGRGISITATPATPCSRSLSNASPGLSFRAFTHDRIFAPLGITHTHFHDDHSEIVRDGPTAISTTGRRFPRQHSQARHHWGEQPLHHHQSLALWAKQLRRPARPGSAVMEQMLTPGVLNDGTVLDYALSMVRALPGSARIRAQRRRRGLPLRFRRLPQDTILRSSCSATSAR